MMQFIAMCVFAMSPLVHAVRTGDVLDMSMGAHDLMNESVFTTMVTLKHSGSVRKSCVRYASAGACAHNVDLYGILDGNQQWKLEAVADQEDVYTLQHMGSAAKGCTKYLSAGDCGKNVDLYGALDGNQEWKIHPAGGEEGVYILQHMGSYRHGCILYLSAGSCAHNVDLFGHLDGNQKWEIPEFPKENHFRSPTGKWIKTASGPDIVYTLTRSVTYEDGKAMGTSNAMQIGASVTATAGINVEFISAGVERTLSTSYTHEWSQTITDTVSQSVLNTCTVNCPKGDLPGGATKWWLYQWKQGIYDNQKRSELTIGTCDYVCVPTFDRPHTPPQCPLGCCATLPCDKCFTTTECS